MGLRERWTISADDVGEISMQGNLLDQEYTFEQAGPLGAAPGRYPS